MTKPISQKNYKTIALAVICALASTSTFAQGLPTTGTIESPIGPLEVKNGYPTEKTVAKLYEALDFQRATQAYIWALPYIAMAEWQRDAFGASDFDYVNYLDFKDKLGILTANATTPYAMAFPNLEKTGPLVFEIPAGAMAGGIMDFWERPLTFSKTYYVDNGSAHADDQGPGSSDRPFRTISRAAQILQPGERVVIASGTYRECVRPERGGTGADKMISYEAAPGAKVYIKGSEIIKEGWTQDPVNVFRRPGGPEANPAAPPPPSSWGYQFTGATFPDAYNPFALASVAGDRAWLDTKSVDMGPSHVATTIRAIDSAMKYCYAA